MLTHKPGQWSLSKALANGAVVGPVVIFLNVYFGGQLPTIGFANLAMMMLGGLFGGAFLFLAIALFARFLGRSAGRK